ncbi:MAG: ABC transporter permease [SAR324 cluster bacterium]|nr:ABC transporter permease [SAR324 cluster bacterium]
MTANLQVGRPVYRYLIRRFLLMIPTLFFVTVIVFILMRMIPGDVVVMKLVGEGADVTEEQIEIERENLGLNRSYPVQFLDWAWGALKFDFGKSMLTGDDVSRDIKIALPASLQIAIMATLLSIVLAIPLGTWAALRQDTWVDYCVRIFSIAGLATPSFWLGMMMIIGILIITDSQWAPPFDYIPIWEDPWYNLSMLIWPALATGYRYSAVAMRMTRSTVLEVLREDYIRTARAKGLLERIVINRHALTNAMLPVVTVIGMEFAFLVGGLVVTEQVFNIAGLGNLFVDSVIQKDYMVVQALVLLVAFVIVFMNFMIDILYAWLDPRISYA